MRQKKNKNLIKNKLTQFQGGKTKRLLEAENLWMNGFWNLRDTTQNVYNNINLDNLDKNVHTDQPIYDQ